MRGIRKKLRSEKGIALIFVILLTAIIVVCISIFYVLYLNHLRDSRRLFDEVTVSTAERIAKETYILDIKSDGVTYYYDEVSRTVTESTKFEGRINIKGYGRTYEKDNRKGETGAIGIPNKGENGGPQLLAVSIEEDGTVHSRWQGNYLTAYDYELMTRAERNRLTTEQLDQIDASLIYEIEAREAETATETEAEVKAETEAETGLRSDIVTR